MKNESYTPSIAIPPGETLFEFLETKKMKQSEFARYIKRPLKFVNELIMGKVHITPKTAIQLANFTDSDPLFWLRLDAQYWLLLEMGKERMSSERHSIKRERRKRAKK